MEPFFLREWCIGPAKGQTESILPARMGELNRWVAGQRFAAVHDFRDDLESHPEPGRPGQLPTDEAIFNLFGD